MLNNMNHLCAFCRSLIRLEFNSEGCGYYTELDAVELIGKAPSGMLVCTCMKAAYKQRNRKAITGF